MYRPPVDHILETAASPGRRCSLATANSHQLFNNRYLWEKLARRPPPSDDATHARCRPEIYDPASSCELRTIVPLNPRVFDPVQRYSIHFAFVLSVVRSHACIRIPVSKRDPTRVGNIEFINSRGRSLMRDWPALLFGPRERACVSLILRSCGRFATTALTSELRPSGTVRRWSDVGRLTGPFTAGGRPSKSRRTESRMQSMQARELYRHVCFTGKYLTFVVVQYSLCLFFFWNCVLRLL